MAGHAPFPKHHFFRLGLRYGLRAFRNVATVTSTLMGEWSLSSMITTTQTHVCLILILGLGIFGCARTTARVSLDPIDAETPRNLTRHRAEDRTPTWSTLGQMLLFESDRAGNRDIWSMVPDGSSALAMTDNAGDDMYPAWSPGGGRFVFQSARGGVAGLWVMEIGTQRVTLLLEDDSPELTPDWSPDLRWIAFTSERSGNPDLWVVAAPPAGSSTGSAPPPRQLTDNSYRDVWPRWSPDGASILFFSRRDTAGERDELYLMRWSDGSVRRLTVNPSHHDFGPSWSPDGEHIVAAVSDSVSDRALVIYDLGGNPVHRFAEGYHRVFQPAWSPDGHSIAYAGRVRDGVGAEIFVTMVPELSIAAHGEIQSPDAELPR